MISKADEKSEQKKAENEKDEKIDSNTVEAENSIEEPCDTDLSANEDNDDENKTKFAALDEDEACKENSDLNIFQQGESDVIDIGKLRNFTQSEESKSSNPPNFNSYINQHNKAQGNCQSCQRKRASQ